MLARDPSRIEDPRFRTLFPAVRRARDGALVEEHARPRDFESMAETLRPMGERYAGSSRAEASSSPARTRRSFPYALAYHTELELFAQGGLTPFEVLQTATMRAAEALGEGANLGSIEAGKLADLVIVTDDPLDRYQERAQGADRHQERRSPHARGIAKAIANRPTGQRANRSSGRKFRRCLGRVLANDDGPRPDLPRLHEALRHVGIVFAKLLNDRSSVARKTVALRRAPQAHQP